MQSIIWTGRLLTRALWNSVTTNTTSSYSTTCAESCPRVEHGLYSAISGIPKRIDSSTKHFKGKFGDDAWFIAKWKNADVLGVADGVGGWRLHGIDPGAVALALMKNCERFVTLGKFQINEPTKLLATSYYEIYESKRQIIGSTTACIVIFDRDSKTLYTANIGDSGFIIVRQGQVVHRSEEQVHHFNTPYQLAVPPEDMSTSVFTDSPDSAIKTSFQVEDGDVILLATDGVFDNVPVDKLVIELAKLEGERSQTKIQKVANTIAFMAHKLSLNGTFFSPFAKAARKHGIPTMGGKPDDITVLLATIS